MDFFKYFISYPNFDQKLAKSRLFLARKKSPGGAQTLALLIATHLLYQLCAIFKLLRKATILCLQQSKSKRSKPSFSSGIAVILSQACVAPGQPLRTNSFPLS